MRRRNMQMLLSISASIETWWIIDNWQRNEVKAGQVGKIRQKLASARWRLGSGRRSNSLKTEMRRLLPARLGNRWRERPAGWQLISQFLLDAGFGSLRISTRQTHNITRIFFDNFFWDSKPMYDQGCEIPHPQPYTPKH